MPNQLPTSSRRAERSALVLRGSHHREGLRRADRRKALAHRATAPRRTGHAAPLPTGRRRDLYVLEGEVTFYLQDGQLLAASSGAVVHLLKGVAHAYRVDSETARVLNITTPQHESFFRAASEPAQARTLPPQAPPDMDKVIMAAANEYGVEILGPPPGADA